jgi:hypothetical protein
MGLHCRVCQASRKHDYVVEIREEGEEHKQAIAIGLSKTRKKGAKAPKEQAG